MDVSPSANNFILFQVKSNRYCTSQSKKDMTPILTQTVDKHFLHHASSKLFNLLDEGSPASRKHVSLPAASLDPGEFSSTQ